MNSTAKLRYALAFVGAALLIPAYANADQPAASINTISRSLVGDWYGSGDLKLRASLCIASNSGRYQLDIVAPPLFRSQTPTATIHVVFKDETGVEQTVELQNQAQLTFTGTTTSRDSTCSNGRLATLEMTFPETLLTAQEAGDYMSQFALSVRPL